MAGSNGPFGLDPEDFDRFAREAGEGLRDVVGKFFDSPGTGSPWSVIFDDATRRTRPQPQPETTGEAGSGVWAIFVVDDDGGARVEQVYSGEVEALRANQHNTDPRRKVRFLPYGIAVSALDEEDSPEA
ncbi:hypothetical protein [Gordonia soli]|uniref:Transmembrane protein n=1 Tax=Gordonia soli NBRC 108243 TaxID=1223545 RepID=M0QDH5_9ACTN|nr:hypothetical protein [Gordonia soli]GAC66489.1 hypothetical protein GS4_02_02000 [Gordonia soli NBRC 108243]